MSLTMLDTIKPKSDQLNADDLTGRELTITITRVTIGAVDQPQSVSVFFDGDGGRPWKPCPTMRRILVGLWGDRQAVYTGRTVTLYVDKTVQYGGETVGGIRIRAMSHIDGDQQVIVTKSKTKRTQVKIECIGERYTPPAAPIDHGATRDTLKAAISRAPTADKLKNWWGGKPSETIETLPAPMRLELLAAYSAALDALIASEADAAATIRDEFTAQAETDARAKHE